jgi:hypothetical protein
MTREERLKAIQEMDEVIERAERACQSNVSRDNLDEKD